MSDTAFPDNVLDVIQPRLKIYLGKYTFARRPVRLMDPALSIGMFPDQWLPLEESHETGQEEATVNRYLYRIQLLVKHATEDEGRRIASIDSKVLRTILYREPQILLGLRSLQETVFSHKERFQRFGVANQRFIGNEISGEHVFTSTTTIWVETETIQVPTAP